MPACQIVKAAAGRFEGISQIILQHNLERILEKILVK
jgi:hypothetical protein